MVCKKVSVAIGFMFRAKPVLKEPQLTALHNALFLPHLSYYNLIWAINFSSHINRLFLLQKRAARVILGLPYCHPVSHRLSELKISSIVDLRDLKCLLLIYKIKHNNAPNSVKKLIEWRTIKQRHHQLRNFNPVVVPFSKTVYRQQTFRVYAAKLFNNLNSLDEINLHVPISSYKKSLKELISSLHCN